MNYFDIGRIVNFYGIKGEIKIIPLTEEPERFKKLKFVSISVNDKIIKYNIEKIKYHKQFIILKLENINSIDEANFLKGSLIKIEKEFAIPLKEHEYYISDLHNMDVFTEQEEYLGIIEEIIKTGANDVYLVKKEGKKDLLIPAIKKCILKVDVNSKKMIVKLLEGLR